MRESSMNSLGKYLACLGLLLSSTVVLADSGSKTLEPVSAEFLTSQCEVPCTKEKVRLWWMLRDQATIEIRNGNHETHEQSNFSQLWRLGPKEKLSYLYIMHKDKRAIEYLFDDLGILGISADKQKWEILNKLVTDQELSQLTKTSKKTADFQGYSTEEYTGVLNEKDVHLVWMPALKLPVSLTYTQPKHKIEIKLQKLANQQQTIKDMPLSSKQALINYESIYFTDIGDMELNGNAHEWIAQAPGAPGLSSHHH